MEGAAEGACGQAHLAIDELAADLVLSRELGDGLRAGECQDGEALSLLGREGVGGAGRGGGAGVSFGGG